MPEFILDHGSPEAARAYRALDSFTQGYIEAMFFTDCEHGTVRADEDEDAADIGGNLWNPETQSNLPGDVTLANLAPEALARIIADCAAFQKANEATLDEAYALEEPTYCAERAGNDFWYTRNGHGCGFWDRGLGMVGDKLADTARVYGGCDSYLGDDGLIYLG